MFGSKKPVQEWTPNPPTLRRWEEPEFIARVQRERDAWLARRQELSDAAMADGGAPFRIVQNTEFGTWSAERRVLSKPDAPTDTDMVLWQEMLHSQAERLFYPPTYSMRLPAAVYDWTIDPVVTWFWAPLSQQAFNTYAEAEAWLAGWINPVCAEVYFDAAGNKVAA